MCDNLSEIHLFFFLVLLSSSLLEFPEFFLSSNCMIPAVNNLFRLSPRLYCRKLHSLFFAECFLIMSNGFLDGFEITSKAIAVDTEIRPATLDRQQKENIGIFFFVCHHVFLSSTNVKV